MDQTDYALPCTDIRLIDGNLRNAQTTRYIMNQQTVDIITSFQWIGFNYCVTVNTQLLMDRI